MRVHIKMNLFERDFLLNKNGHRTENKGEGKYWTKEARKTWVVYLFVLTSILFAARVAMPVCATAISIEFGWNKADLGAVMGSFFWGYVTTQVLGGYFADRIGGDKVLIMSSLSWGTITLLTPNISDLHMLFGSSIFILTLARIALGVMQGVHYPSMISLLARKIPESERSLPMGVILAAGNFGSLLCGGVGSILLEHYGWKRVFQVLGLISLSWTYFMWTSTRKRQNTVISLDSMVYSQPIVPPSSDSVPWQIIFSKSQVWAVIFAHFCMNNCFFILLSWLPTFFHERFPNEKGWIYNVIPWMMSIPSSVFAGWLSERFIKNNISVTFTRKFNQCIAMCGSGIFSIILTFCKEFWTAVLCAGLAVSLQTFHNSGVLVNPQDIAPSHAGSVFGVMNAFGAITSFLGVYITGCILNVSGTWELVFTLMALINVAGATTFVIWGTGQRVI
uniref:solute carrier family 17 member 9-like n=1 Tax=Ciona intestinalis TaxID=7719 RepID=UPI000180BA65|nr:solute carrier family 17 member 9-like [Ciona intestinalis]|eukprot:XP_002131108.1 solute carrier family 17 member 9-like [Ciona intestinalis]